MWTATIYGVGWVVGVGKKEAVCVNCEGVLGKKRG